MKIVLMNGGLGNQLFQYAFYRYIQIATNDICYIDDSAFWGNNIEHNGFEIERIFGVKCNLLSRFFDNDVWIEKINKKQEGISIPQQLLNAGIDISVIAETDDLAFNGEVIEVNNDNDLINKETNIYYHGYWITDKWFSNIKEVLLAELKFNDVVDEQNEMYLEYIKKTSSIALHVRRGDFVDLKRTLDMDYYIENINNIESFINDAVYFVFSDDIDWCRKHYDEIGLDKVKNRVIFVFGNSSKQAYVDMQLMVNCKHMILANSSFSAFASNLNTNKNKIIILPN